MSATIKREMEISITPTAEELAEVFWTMGSNQQAAFFNHLYGISNNRLCFQLQAVTDEPCINVNGRYAMRLIGEYSEGSQP